MTNTAQTKVTSQRMTWDGSSYDEAKFAKCAARAAMSIQKSAARFGNPMSDEEAAAAGRQYAEYYRHHFRAYKAAL